MNYLEKLLDLLILISYAYVFIDHLPQILF